MRLQYIQSTKPNTKPLNKRIRTSLECLLLALIMSVLTIFLVVQKSREITLNEEYVEVSQNAFFDFIELELNSPIENTDSNNTGSVFWNAFERYQAESNE